MVIVLVDAYEQVINFVNCRVKIYVNVYLKNV